MNFLAFVSYLITYIWVSRKFGDKLKGQTKTIMNFNLVVMTGFVALELIIYSVGVAQTKGSDL